MWLPRIIFPILLLSSRFYAVAQLDFRLAIDYQFNEALDFSDNGLAAVKNEDLWGFIDKDGKVIINYQFNNTLKFTSSGLAAVKKGKNWAIIDQKGTVIVDYHLDDARPPDSTGLVAVESGDKWGFINSNGTLITNFIYDDVHRFSSNGLAPVEKEYKWGFIDQSGTLVIDYQFDDASPFGVNGMAAVREGDVFTGKWGFIDQTGKIIVKCQFDYTSGFADNGLAAVKEFDKWGYIDQNGSIVIDFKFEWASNFASNNLAVVKNGGKLGYIDPTGNAIIPCQYDYASGFAQNGLAVVRKGSKWGYIDKSGKSVIDFLFDDARSFTKNGLAAVKIGNNWGYIGLHSPSNDISDFVKKGMDQWLEKGKYETTEEYKDRISEVNKKKKHDELSVLAVHSIAPEYCKWDSKSAVYNADDQTFTISVSGLHPFSLKVPLSEAEAFDRSMERIQFQNQEYLLADDEKFVLQQATIKNPLNGKVYNYFAGERDVDVNIPVTAHRNLKTFVAIIANENYQREVKVQFAANDGIVFRNYCENTLGIPAANIHLVKDASYGNIKSEIKWITDVALAYKGQAKLIFYYAGHGMPNEADRSPYLLPVDGYSSDYESAIKLNDLYDRLGLSPCRNITIFLDACFSGSLREDGMLTNARGIKIKPKSENLKGNIVVFSAATGDETAYPYEEKQHGLFTYFLLKKLQESLGNVDYKTLSNYIIDNVQRQSVVVNHKSQTPQVITSPDLMETWQNFKLLDE